MGLKWPVRRAGYIETSLIVYISGVDGATKECTCGYQLILGGATLDGWSACRVEKLLIHVW